MISRLRSHFGAAGLIVAIVALIAALGGAALAVTTGSSGKATASAKANKGLRGARGPAGPAGPAGPTGPAGANGKDGTNGANGKDGIIGKDGTNGTDGVSITSYQLEPGEGGCPSGGIEYFAVNGATVLCNGKDGAQGKDGIIGVDGAPGPEGSPWTAGGTLPPAATETGTYTLSGPASAFEEYVVAPISFAIPLEEGLDGEHTILVPRAGAGEPPDGPAECQNPAHPGVANAANPEADPGYLCVYEGRIERMKESGEEYFVFARSSGEGEGADRTGATLWQKPETGATTNGYVQGTWAVTAPEAP